MFIISDLDHARLCIQTQKKSRHQIEEKRQGRQQKHYTSPNAASHHKALLLFVEGNMHVKCVSFSQENKFEIYIYVMLLFA